MTACTPAVPSGEALYAEAESNYLRYRGFVNELQSSLSTQPWRIGQLGSYGMQPSECDGPGTYQFRLDRAVQLDAAQRVEYADTVESFLNDKGMTPSRGTLGSDSQEGQLIQVKVRDEGDFELLLIEIGKTGDVLISARTACWPGDRAELSERLFGGVYLGDGYLPVDTESPTDPLFFGITPGDPQFVRETPSP
ncbi:hypothetical protein FVO59_04470 [Microbacterium esteraromaticum]|uniref:Uncharacterized protein n=1 Tax=Microbacterium esteraromaticum TaxID=57043 RepID=A0A7D8AAZ2_9MICO|nr:hypothetical protein [Microbacterium esteraromaticum]QMU96544.1 hypothetical protein FVO59_04470 [Microbacterium esteraromaticum]